MISEMRAQRASRLSVRNLQYLLQQNERLILSFLEFEPKDLIDADWLEEYNLLIDAIWWQLIRLNSTMLVLQKIIEFPFRILFPPPYRQHFWDLTTNSFFDSCVLIIWRVAVDTSDEGLSLPQLKNQLMRHIRNNRSRAQIGKAFNAGKHEEHLNEMRVKIEHLRHNYIAHFNRVRNTRPTDEDIKERTLFFEELKNYQVSVNSYFNFLCFGRQRMLYPLEYNPTTLWPAGTDTRIDIQQILDLVAISSPFMNFPEINPVLWESYRKNLSDEEKQIMKEYRQKAGLDELDDQIASKDDKSQLDFA